MIAHWITRPGFGPDPPIYHNPPLLYNLDLDSAESIELNTSIPQYAEILEILEKEYQRHKTEIENAMPYPQYDPLNWDVVPCCDKPFNASEAKEFEDMGYPGLAAWDECVCNLTPSDLNYTVNHNLFQSFFVNL